MKRRQRRLFITVFSVIALCQLLTGCIPRHVNTLKIDALSDPKYESIVFGKVYLNSKEELLEYVAGTYMNVFFTNPKGEPEVDLIWVKLPLGFWQRSYEREYNIPFFGEIEPGAYWFELINFNDNTEWFKEPKFTARLADFSKLVFSAPPAKLVYLGTIDMEILSSSYRSKDEYHPVTKEKIIGERTFTYRVHVRNELKEELDAFKIKYPLLYERFKDSVVSAPWVK